MLRKKWHYLVIVCWFLAGCGLNRLEVNSNPLSASNDAEIIIQTPTVQRSEATRPYTLWVDPAVPEQVRQLIESQNLVEYTSNSDEADGWLTQVDAETGKALFSQVYVLAAAFPTLEDGMTLDRVESIWTGSAESPPNVLVLEPETIEVFAGIWGAPQSDQLHRVDANDLITTVWQTTGAVTILPFDALDPRLKVLAIDGFNPLEKGLEVDSYPLTIQYGLQKNPNGDQSRFEGLLSIFQEDVKVINRDENRLTSVLLTGTTALSRNTAFVMEEKGILYPARDIGDWLRTADITHISNEVPMFAGCPPAKPLREEARFCSDPAYLGLFDDTGVDVIELTGNHLLDWGAEAFLDTLDLYDQNGYAYYGGGRTPEDGSRALLIEEHGNKIAFLGCNAVGPEQVWATNSQPGPVKCDLDRMESQVRTLKQDGYVVIVTFQHFELDEYRPQSSQRIDFQRMARAGVDIVSGSQAHSPQTMTFIGKHFIHYGLGNLFFDQMFAGYDREFLDEHFIYDGKFISTQLRTALLEDYARPRPMNADERRQLLEAVFSAAEWNIE